MTPNLMRVPATVGANGEIEVAVPLAEGTPIEVLVLSKQGKNFDEMLIAASSPMSFWDNSIDDETWNNG
jgi:hypothetical protein